MEKTESLKRALRCMSAFFNETDTEHIKPTICSVEVVECDYPLFLVKIETHRPGMIIGKGGNTIDELTRWLTSEFGQEVKIELKESPLWYGNDSTEENPF